MNDLISRKALLAEYDRVHIGIPGRARKLIENAPKVDAAELPTWATETAYKNGYEQGKKDAADNNVGCKWIPVSERLPERDLLVLCIGAKGGMFIGNPRCVYGNEDTAYTYVPNSRGGRQTKYWMPLPEPPKGE
jgi:hypothetical protein